MSDGFVTIQSQDFDSGELSKALQDSNHGNGAICTFVGFVRQDRDPGNLCAMHLEHYEGMTQNSIASIISRAQQRWDIGTAGVVHRVGTLQPGEQIVWVGVSSRHREQAFSACEYIMDYLKTEAPIWKKEIRDKSEQWVESKTDDTLRRQRWSES